MADTHLSVFKRIWVPFFILTGITAFEFLVAFTMPKDQYGDARLIIFVLMTIAKAFYIVAYFMHLKFERINLGYSIVVPMLFVVYLLVLLIQEGGALFDVMN